MLWTTCTKVFLHSISYTTYFNRLLCRPCLPWRSCRIEQGRSCLWRWWRYSVPAIGNPPLVRSLHTPTRSEKSKGMASNTVLAWLIYVSIETLSGQMRHRSDFVCKGAARFKSVSTRCLGGERSLIQQTTSILFLQYHTKQIPAAPSSHRRPRLRPGIQRAYRSKRIYL